MQRVVGLAASRFHARAPACVARCPRLTFISVVVADSLVAMHALCFLVATCAAFSPTASLLQRPAVRRAAAPAMQMPPAASELLALLGRAGPDPVPAGDGRDRRAVRRARGQLQRGRRRVDTRPEHGRCRDRLSFATYSKLEPAATLQLFGDYYRKDVLEHPDATDHANIRAFMKVGWDGVKFPDGLAVTPKKLRDYVTYGARRSSTRTTTIE